MGLSSEQRQALQDRAAGLRAEVSSLTAEREDAETTASQDLRDAQLVKEIEKLELQRDAAAAGRDRAVGTVEAAAAAMEKVAAEQAGAATVSVPADNNGTVENAAPDAPKGVAKGTRTAAVEGTEVK